jgi:hypothetical protein
VRQRFPRRARWNKLVPEYNAVVAPRDIGRPVAASDAQQTEVMVLHKAGKSLRWIAGATGLGLRTVRTIVDKAGLRRWQGGQVPQIGAATPVAA